MTQVIIFHKIECGKNTEEQGIQQTIKEFGKTEKEALNVKCMPVFVYISAAGMIPCGFLTFCVTDQKAFLRCLRKYPPILCPKG